MTHFLNSKKFLLIFALVSLLLLTLGTAVIQAADNSISALESDSYTGNFPSDHGGQHDSDCGESSGSKSWSHSGRRRYAPAETGTGGCKTSGNGGGHFDPPSFQGCTPGYWKQAHHFDSWVGYAPGDNFGTVFGVPRNVTLLQALSAGGGGEIAMGRHAVAALLNSTNSGVNYKFTTAEVIAKVQWAYATGHFNLVQFVFEWQNEKNCPLN
jgi:hypothetical protein